MNTIFSGIGIASDGQKTVFEKFSQIYRTPTDMPKRYGFQAEGIL